MTPKRNALLLHHGRGSGRARRRPQKPRSQKSRCHRHLEEKFARHQSGGPSAGRAQTRLRQVSNARPFPRSGKVRLLSCTMYKITKLPQAPRWRRPCAVSRRTAPKIDILVGTMDPEFSRLLDEAASISTSGRWTAVNESIERLSANPGVGNEWWVQLFGSLCFQIFSQYLSLKRAYEGKHDKSSLLAWRARNLLELSVWCIYCSKSRENARHLYEDAGRDVLGLFSAFTKWGTATAQDPEWLNLLTGAKQRLSQQAVADGIASLDGPFTEVRDAAGDVGIGEQFRLSNRMLSKFAHPTAMQILGLHDEA